MPNDDRARLLALDLDGTLVSPGDKVDPRDAAAIEAARAEGVTVTLATGRLGAGALGVARALGLTAPLICADGGLLICPESGDPLEQLTIDPRDMENVLAAFRAHELSPFALVSDAVHGDEAGARHEAYVASWAPRVVLHPGALEQSAAWRAQGALLAMGIGPEASARAAESALCQSAGPTLDITAFTLLGDVWAVRAQPPGCTKGRALARLAERLGVPRDRVAAVGDWHNDISMFLWSARSFAMGHAPAPVREAATDILTATAATGGGVAEAIARWLGH